MHVALANSLFTICKSRGTFSATLHFLVKADGFACFRRESSDGTTMGSVLESLVLRLLYSCSLSKLVAIGTVHMRVGGCG